MAAEVFTRTQTGSALALAVVAGCVPALQPILLGGLLAEHRLTASQIGQAATLEAIGMAVSAAVAGAWFKTNKLRAIAVAAAAMLCLANFMTMLTNGNAILLSRALNGAASGVLLWILVGLMTRSENPGRLFAVYVLLQAIVSFLLAALFSTVIVPRFGIAGGYGVLVALGVFLLLPIATMKPTYTPIAASHESRWPTARGSVGLVAVALNMAGIFALWVYLVPLGVQLGFARETVGIAVSAAIGVQILGGLVSFALAGRIGGATVTATSAGLSALLILLMFFFSTLSSFYITIGLVAFFYSFAAPFHMPLLLTADPSHRSAMFVSSAQLVGVAAGPMIASLTVSHIGFRGAAMVSGVLFAGAALFALASSSRKVASPPILHEAMES